MFTKPLHYHCANPASWALYHGMAGVVARSHRIENVEENRRPASPTLLSVVSSPHGIGWFSPSRPMRLRQDLCRDRPLFVQGSMRTICRKRPAKHVYRRPSLCRNTYGEAMCRGVPTGVPMAASLSGTIRGLEVLVLVSLTSRRRIDTSDRSRPRTSS